MTTKTLNTQITFTPYTIDTYNVFTFDRVDNAFIEDDRTYDDYEWEYNHAGYVQALADNWEVLMQKNILDDVILGVTLDGKAYSPREYNYTTDNAQVVFTINYDALLAYIEKNKEAYDRDHIRDYDGFWWLGDEDDTMLHYYLHTKTLETYPESEYMQDQDRGVSAYEYVEAKIKN